ncbi:MAG: DegQ family serine endoprotease [Verrucomicrobiia bacterium]
MMAGGEKREVCGREKRLDIWWLLGILSRSVDRERKSKQMRVWTSLMSVGAGLLLGSGVVALAFLPGQKGGPGPEVRVDTSPVERGGGLASSFAPVIREAAPSVVNIYTTRTVRMGGMRDPFFEFFFGPRMGPGVPQERQQQGLGSGVIVSSDGYILTNHHVIDGVDGIRVRLADDRNSEYAAKVVGSDEATDIAVLKVEASGLPAAVLGDSGAAEVGDVVLAIGNPFNIGQTVTLGIISAKGRQLPPDRVMGSMAYQDFIQTDASINPGNSGGALIDAAGRVIGINTAIFSQTGGNLGIGFAVPINLARDVMTQLISTGRVARGFLGVEIQEVDADLAKQFGLKEPRGVLITGVTPGGAAEEAGLKRRDVIVEFNGEKVGTVQELRFSVARVPPGQKATVKVVRDGKERTVQVKLRDRDEAVAGVGPSPAPSRESEGSTSFAGMEWADVTPALAQQFGLGRGVKGAVVVAVETGSPAAQAEIRPGDVITEIGDQPVDSAAAASRIVRDLKTDRVLLFVMRGGVGRYVLLKDL